MGQFAPEVIRLRLCYFVPIGPYLHPMVFRAPLKLAGLVLLLAGCHRSGPFLRYVGKADVVVRKASDLDLMGGSRPPKTHRVLGVLTARCETYDGASGALRDQCNEVALTRALRQHAAGVGATALFDVRCTQESLRRELERDDNVGAVAHELSAQICQATVLRGSPLVAGTKTGQ